jgi:hypothetical protein
MTSFEVWSPSYIFLAICLFQFGLVLVMFAILKLDVRNSMQLETQSVKTDLATDTSLKQMTDAINHSLEPNQAVDININNSVANPAAAGDSQLNPVSKEFPSPSSYSVEISPELFIELLEISNNPAATVDEAIRWWLRRRTLDTMNAVQDRRDRLGMRSHRSLRSLQNSWND